MSAPKNFAKRAVEKYELTPPIDVEELVRRYASLHYEAISIKGVDGVCIDLKVVGKTPKVIINSLNPPARRRFTLAHELGHVLVPWHKGTIVDYLDAAGELGNLAEYSAIETEANEFAAELLMPESWILREISRLEDLAALHKEVVRKCEVSPQAASIRLCQLLPPNIVFSVERDGQVEFSGRTEGTLVDPFFRNTDFPKSPFPFAEHHFQIEIDNRTSHWWVFPQTLTLSSVDERSWREILDCIIDDLGIPFDEKMKYKASINGILAAANGVAKVRAKLTAEVLQSACVQRLQSRKELSSFVEHRLFGTFVLKRCQDFLRHPADNPKGASSRN